MRQSGWTGTVIGLSVCCSNNCYRSWREVNEMEEQVINLVFLTSIVLNVIFLIMLFLPEPHKEVTIVYDRKKKVGRVKQ
jgi:hypothetical protein